jgi:hypothetical protein
MYFLYKNEYRLIKAVEITIRKVLRLKGETLEEMKHSES